MGSVVPDVSSQKAVEPGLFDVGRKLLRRASSTDELLNLLEKAESLLAIVWQQPPRSTRGALLPIMKSLIKDELLCHDDVNVQVALASCFNELSRITAPDFPYADAKMRVIFKLFMVAFEYLSGEPGHNYYRAIQIVETMAKVRSSLMLLDVDNDDDLVVEMFQLFLKNVRANHPSDIFKYMEMVMTMVIEEIDEISFALLRPLLASVKMHNKDAKPMSWVLGTKVFENCAIKLQCCLREAVEAMRLDLEDFADIVAFIYHGTFKEKNMVSEKVSPIEINLDEENPIETSKGCNQVMHSVSDGVALRKRRCRKPTIRSEEGYEHTAKSGSKLSNEASPNVYNEECITLPSETGNSSNSSHKKVEFLSLQKKIQSKKNQQNDLHLSSTLKNKILNSKEKDHSAPKKTGKKATADTRMEKKEIISQKCEWEDGADKMEDSPVSRHAKSKSQGKEKKSRRLWSGNGEEVVNVRIEVWWPEDKVYYPGTVKAFDPKTKKHTILYDDGEIEVLNLRKEIWKKLGNEEPHKNPEAESSLPREPIQNKEKNLKRKAATLKKNNTASSSKRLKDENRKISNSRDASPPGSDHLFDEPEDAESNGTL